MKNSSPDHLQGKQHSENAGDNKFDEKPEQEKSKKSQKCSLTFDENDYYTAKDLIGLNLESYPTIWGSILPKVGIAVLAGSSDCGKSRLSRQMAISICKGDESFMGLTLRPKHKQVLVFSTEDDEYSIGYILNKQFKSHMGKEYLNRLHYKFQSDDYVKDAHEFLSKNPCDMIIADSWGDILKSSPNDFTAVRNAMIPWRELARTHQCLVLIIHHTVKNSEKTAPDKNKLNGSQSMEAKARCVLELRAITNTNERALSIVKCNHLSEKQKNRSIILEINNETLLFKDTGKRSDRASLNDISTKKFDAVIWLNRFNEVRSKLGTSIDKTREALVKTFANEDVPSSSWFKENYKDDPSQSNESNQKK